MNKLSIKEISDLAGVSTATVSRMLNENGFVKEETRSKIMAVIKSTGYDPSSRKRKIVLPSSRNKNLRILMLWNATIEQQQSRVAQELLEGISESIQKMGATLGIDYINPQGDLPPSLISSPPDGILIHGETPPPKIWKELTKRPLVWLLQRGRQDYGDRIQPHHDHVGAIASDYFMSKKCKRVCCVTYKNMELDYYSRTRSERFYVCAKESGIHCDMIEVEAPNSDDSIMAEQLIAARNAAEKIKKIPHTPEALFVANDLGVYLHSELSKIGIKPMEDILMIAGDEDLCTIYLDPEPVKVRILAKEIGVLATEALVTRIENPKLPSYTSLIRPELVFPQ
jgi:LacI family transcriptional regulator